MFLMVKVFLKAKEFRTVFTRGEAGREARTGSFSGEEPFISKAPKMWVGSRAHFCSYGS